MTYQLDKYNILHVRMWQKLNCSPQSILSFHRNGGHRGHKPRLSFQPPLLLDHVARLSPSEYG